MMLVVEVRHHPQSDFLVLSCATPMESSVDSPIYGPSLRSSRPRCAGKNLPTAQCLAQDGLFDQRDTVLTNEGFDR